MPLSLHDRLSVRIPIGCQLRLYDPFSPVIQPKAGEEKCIHTFPYGIRSIELRLEFKPDCSDSHT